jgi:PucR C-terminal helix-turn-helix domain/GGDEF-like domain
MGREMPEESLDEVRANVCARLQRRRSAIEHAILARFGAIPTPPRSGSADRLRRAVSAGVDYGLAGIGKDEDDAGSIPLSLLTEARKAAARGQALDLVLCRYFAGYALLNDFVLRAAEDGAPLPGPALRRTLEILAELFEELLVAVVGAYADEARGRRRPSERRQVECVKDLLAGEPVDASDLRYEFADWHLGMVASGSQAISALRSLAEAADRRLLLVRPDGETIWAWFAGRRRVAVAEVASHISLDGSSDALVAIGEPARGVDGWRLTHRQASAAFSIARRGAESVVRYADVGLLASISQDQLLATSLRQLYLAPLADGRDGGAGLRETLRAYFLAGRNISSAASALGVSRQTVGNRLRVIEEKLGRTLESCGPEIEVALRLERIGDVGDAALPSPTHLEVPSH